MQTKQALLSKKGNQNRSSNRIYDKGKRKFLHFLTVVYKLHLKKPFSDFESVVASFYYSIIHLKKF